jgi:hypothetical protein
MLFPSKPATAKTELQYNVFVWGVLIYVNTLSYIHAAQKGLQFQV